MIMVKNICFSLAVLLILSSCQHSSVDKKSSEGGPGLSSNYLGQTPPGDSAVVFAPGIVGTGLYTRDIAISPSGDEIYYGVSLGGYTYTTILVCRRIKGRWTGPELAPWCTDPNTMYLEPAMNQTGDKLFFLSTMADGDEEAGDQDIWYVKRLEEGWSEPLNVGPPINSENAEFFPSLTSEGHMYFTRAAKGSQLNQIYRSELVEGVYQDPELLPPQVNCGSNRFNAFISKNEDYIIVPALGMEDTYGGADYYIVFRDENNNWSDPQHMGPTVNSEAMREWSPYVSRDGEYIFFMSDRTKDARADDWNYDAIKTLHNSPGNGNAGIYWVSANIIDELRKSAVYSEKIRD